MSSDPKPDMTAVCLALTKKNRDLQASLRRAKGELSDKDLAEIYPQVDEAVTAQMQSRPHINVGSALSSEATKAVNARRSTRCGRCAAVAKDIHKMGGAEGYNEAAPPIPADECGNVDLFLTNVKHGESVLQCACKECAREARAGEKGARRKARDKLPPCATRTARCVLRTSTQHRPDASP